MVMVSHIAYFACTALAAEHLNTWRHNDRLIADFHSQLQTSIASCHQRIVALMSIEQFPENDGTLQSLIPVQSSLSSLVESYRRNGPLAGSVTHLQRNITMLAESTTARSLRADRLPLRYNALMCANRAKWANTWLVTIPSKPELELPDIYCTAAMRLRLGLPSAAPTAPCECDRVSSLAMDPYHPLNCEKCTGLWNRL
jgi:hypothetical protein